MMTTTMTWEESILLTNYETIIVLITGCDCASGGGSSSSGQTETETNQSTHRKQVVPSSLEAMHHSSGCSSASSTIKKRETPVTDITLCPRTGVLRDRLRVQRGAHMPVPSDSKEAQCAMHRWATKEKKRSQILKCTTCQIHLCRECYKLCHTVEEVAQLRQAYNTSSNVRSVTVASASNMTSI